MHNPSGRQRIAVVNRWAPWWLSVNEFGKPGTRRGEYDCDTLFKT